MAAPYREWTKFFVATIEAFHATQYSISLLTSIDDWTNIHYTEGLLGVRRVAGGYWSWRPLIIPSNEDGTYQLADGMDHIFDFNLEYIMATQSLSLSTITSGYPRLYINTDPSNWLVNKATGKYYDGANEWNTYPLGYSIYDDNYKLDFSLLHDGFFSLPYHRSAHWYYSHDGISGTSSYNDQANLFAYGMIMDMSTYAPPAWGINDIIQVNVIPKKLQVRYLNAVVNSLSISVMNEAGGVPLTLSGLGFKLDDNEPTEHDDGGATSWDHRTTLVRFSGLQGQGNYDVVAAAYPGYTNTSLTIASMPAMAPGSYEIMIRTRDDETVTNHESYAGDWHCDADGRARSGPRLTFFVVASGDVPPPPRAGSGEAGDNARSRRGPLLLSGWTFKNKAGDIETEHYAQIDTRSPSIFYDGRILGISTLTREVDDKTGLHSISDMSVELANNDKHFSMRLADWFMKNQPVDLWHQWRDEPEGWKTSIIRMIVEDYSVDGLSFNVTLKDITQKYFKIKVPRYTCTIDEYADIHESAIGKPMPEVLGLNSITTGDAPGAMEAIYIDTTNYKYLAARGTLKEITEVYSDGLLVAATLYVITYEDGGRTYITFTNDQEEKKITYNAKGYMFAAWDDATNGYVQNPAYIIAYYVAFILEFPLGRIDLEAFDDLAAIYAAMSVDTSGRLIMQGEQDAESVLQQLLFSFGAKGFIDNDGRYKAERKDISNYTTDLLIIRQVDLFDPAARQMNLIEAVNSVKAKYDFYPAANFYAGAKEDDRPSSITDYETEIEPDTPWEFPWTTSGALVDQRLLEELLKRGYGDPKIAFQIPIQWINDLDILTNFQFQDPFALISDGSGEAGRYYYVESLTYDFSTQRIDIIAIDLQWLLRQYFVLGDRDTLADAWTSASEGDRMFGYLCDRLTNEFSDGEPGKIFIDRNSL